jgi:hypothetical protein
MAKGTTSKDKKSGDKGKGKAEEKEKADKGGKVRIYWIPFFVLLCADLEGWAGRVKG